MKLSAFNFQGGRRPLGHPVLPDGSSTENNYLTDLEACLFACFVLVDFALFVVPHIQGAYFCGQ